MFKNFKLRSKIGLGFGSVIVIMTVLGATAVWKMSSVQKESRQLAQKYMPETELAVHLLENAQDTMYEMRGFVFTENVAYLAEAGKKLTGVKEHLADGEELVTKYPELVKLKESVAQQKAHVAEYEKLVEQMIAADKGMDGARQGLDTNAKSFMDACFAYLNDQNKELEKEMKDVAAGSAANPPATSAPASQPAAAVDAAAIASKVENRHEKITAINEIIDLANWTRLAVWRAQAERDPKRIQEAEKNFPAIDEKLAAVRKNTTQQADLQRLDTIQAAAKGYQTAMNDFLKNWQAMQDVEKKSDETGQKVLELARAIAEAGMGHATRIAGEADAELADASKTTLIGLAIAIALGAAFSVMITRIITRPIQKGVAFAQTVAGGDFTQRLDIKQKDEIGQLAGAMNHMADKLSEMIRSITQNALTLSSSSTELSATATQLAGGAEETTSQSAAVSAAAEQMAQSMNNMAASTEQMSANVKTVAAAVEEMTASIGEVAKNAEQAANVADNAAQLAETSNQKVARLGEAADEIGKIIVTIQDIAEQTNLLALNATIEAARAGEAGKGFAVVANEVKELAKQTAEATGNIRKSIEGIQGSIGETVQAIGEISHVIKDVNSVSRTIASAVEEQSITTKEIAQNVAQTANAATTVSEGVAQSASASQEITKNITGVSVAAQQTAQGASHTQVAGQELSKLSEDLKSLVGQFKV